MTAHEILQAALKLEPAARERIVEELAASLQGSFASKEVEQAWLDEIERRSQEIDAGTAELVEWSDVKEQIAERRGRRAG